VNSEQPEKEGRRHAGPVIVIRTLVKKSKDGSQASLFSD
jgi:hypothetical protein